VVAKDPELERLGAAREHAREAMQQAKSALDDAWNELQALQLRYGAKIERLKEEHDQLFALKIEAKEEIGRLYRWKEHDKIPY
jgi:hypothetical protein